MRDHKPAAFTQLESITYWSESLPFFIKKRGGLVHLNEQPPIKFFALGNLE